MSLDVSNLGATKSSCLILEVQKWMAHEGVWFIQDHQTWMGKVKPRGLDSSVCFHSHNVTLELTFEAMLESLLFIEVLQGTWKRGTTRTLLGPAQHRKEARGIWKQPEMRLSRHHLQKSVSNCHAHYKWAPVCLIKMAWTGHAAAGLPETASLTVRSTAQPSLDHWRAAPGPGAVHKSTEKAAGRGELAQQQITV